MTEDEMAGWLTNSMDMSLSELQELVMDREDWRAVIHGVAKSRTRLSNFHLAMLAPYVRNKIQTSFSSVQLLSRI